MRYKARQPLALTPRRPARSMPTMTAITGQIVSSAVTCGLLVSLCACSPAQDIEALRPATLQGDAEAQYNFALMYRNGEGVPQDAAEAVR